MKSALDQLMGADTMRDLNEFIDQYVQTHDESDCSDHYVIETSETALDDEPIIIDGKPVDLAEALEKY